jgi:hypothetical protein
VRSIREDDFKGHDIAITPTYDIRIDASRLVAWQGHIDDVGLGQPGPAVSRTVQWSATMTRGLKQSFDVPAQQRDWLTRGALEDRQRGASQQRGASWPRAAAA